MALSDAHIGIKEVGVTLDFGHAMYGNKIPAEDLCLLAESSHPYYIHINDNDANSDFPTSDTSPTRWDLKDKFEAEGLGKPIGDKDCLKTWAFMESNLFRI